MKNNLHLIGDSHTLMYKELEPQISTYHFGACTAYSLMNPDSFTRSWHTFQNFLRGHSPDTDTIMLLFGEIDCRVLIYYKHMKVPIELSEMIDIVIFRYFGFVDYLRSLLYNVIIHGIPPAVRQSNEYQMEFYGNNSIRSYISEQFNSKLKKESSKRRIGFFDIYPAVVDGEGMTSASICLLDLVHIDPSKFPIASQLQNWLF